MQDHGKKQQQRVEKMVIFVVKAHQTRLFAIKRRYANGVHLSAIWENTALVPWIRCEPLGEHFIHRICLAFSHITRNMNNVCIFSHDEVTHDITAVHSS